MNAAPPRCSCCGQPRPRLLRLGGGGGGGLGGRRAYEKKGFTVLAFPSNDFKNQEPGTEAEIKALVTKKFGVKFPMFSKIHVSGSDVHPVFKVSDWGTDELGWCDPWGCDDNPYLWGVCRLDGLH